MQYLSFSKLPVVLRWLTWLLLLDGSVRVVLWLVAQFSEDPPALRGLATGVLFVYAAVQLRRGRREAIDWLLLYLAAILALFAYLLLFVGAGLSGAQWIVVALGLVMSAYLFWCRQRLPWREAGSFGHWMSDPDLRDHYADWFAMRDQLLEQDRLDPPDPDELVADLLHGDDSEMTRQRLQAQPEHFGMAVFRALGDSAYRRDPDVLSVLVDQLPETLRDRARDRLLECVPHLEGFNRGNLVRTLAASGSAELAPLLVSELAGERGDMAAEGLGTAVKEGKLSDELFAAVETSLRACLSDPDKSGYAAVVLAHRDSSLLPQLIRDAQDFADAPMRAIVELAEAEFELPKDQLRQLWRRALEQREWFWCWRLLRFLGLSDQELRELLPQLPEHFGDAEAHANWQDAHGMGPKYSRHCYATVLEMLVERRATGVEELLRKALDMQLPDVSDVAASQLARLLGAPQDLSFADVDDPTPRQRALRSLGYADALVCNGGFSHAVDCLDVDDMDALEPALQEIAPAAVRDLWLSALRTVSPDPLPRDPKERSDFLMQRYDDISEHLDQLSSEYYREKWALSVAMDLYATEHREELGAL